MALILTGRFRWLARNPRLWAPLAFLFLGILYLCWRGGSILWVRFERPRIERVIAEYDFAEGRRRLDRCIGLRPNDPELRLLAAQTARRDGDLEAARRHLEAYRAAARESTPQFTLERQLIAAQEGRVREVVKELIEAIEIHHPQSEQILEALAMGEVQNYQLPQAIFWVQMLSEKWPKNAIGRLVRAQTTDTQGNREKAIALLQELVAEFPKYYSSRLSLAGILFKSQRYWEAIADYGTLHQQRPGELLPLLGLASSYARLEDPAAGPLMKQLQERFPDDSESLLERGRYAMGQRDPAAAEPLFRRVAELAPFDHEIHREFAVCLEQLGKHEESRQHLVRFKQIEADLVLLEKTAAEMSKAPKDLKPRQTAGEICLRNGQVAEGLRWLHGILDMAPNDVPTHRILADYWAAQGNVERATAHRRQADGLPSGPLN